MRFTAVRSVRLAILPVVVEVAPYMSNDPSVAKSYAMSEAVRAVRAAVLGAVAGSSSSVQMGLP